MPSARPHALALATALLAAAPARSQEALDQAVVRNRLFTVGGRMELSLEGSALLVPRLVDVDNFTAAVGYNISEVWAVELRGGYAVSRHTGLANHLAQDLLLRNPNGPGGQVVTVDDLSNLWEMRGNVVAGVRWAPVYGKLSLLSDAALRFQAYLWLGGGAAMLHRQSVVDCQAVASQSDGTCQSWLTQDRTAPVGSAALGLRFFTGHWGAVRLELRNYVFEDSYLVNINRVVAESGGATGQPARSPGLTHLVLFDVGLSVFL